MKVLIVYAHPPEPRSYAEALLARSVKELEAQGHEVKISDLCRDGFDPVAKAEDFKERRFPDYLQYDREQKHSSAHQSFSDDIAAEIEKLLWCDFMILQFPLWWFAMPAILKGWVDRVFVNGVVYGGGRRYDTGGMKGRRAMIVTSTAAYPSMAATDGLVGDMNVVLWPIQNGTLAYAGFEVLPPFVAWSVHYVDDAQRKQYLEDYAERLRTLETTAPLFFHPLQEFGTDWKLKPEVELRTVGQHRRSS